MSEEYRSQAAILAHAWALQQLLAANDLLMERAFATLSERELVALHDDACRMARLTGAARLARIDARVAVPS